MQQNLVLWGEIGTDQKALLAIHLQEDENKIHIYAFPKEKVSKEVQDKLFSEWKNGGEYEFPDDIYHWEVSASQDNILPPEIRVDRPEMITNAQSVWSIIIMSARLNEVLSQEAGLVEAQLENIKDYDQQLWDRTRELWAKISDYRKKGELSWEHTDVLKSRINAMFDSLKAVKRIDTEKTDEETIFHFKEFLRKIEELANKLVYPDEWDKIFDNLKSIQNEIKDYALSWKHKRVLFDKLNDTFLELRKYRKSEFINRTKDRIKNLKYTLQGFNETVKREQDNYKQQYEKLVHYTRGKLSEMEMNSRLAYIIDRIKEKEEKVNNITQTIQQLVKQVEKEEKAKDELAVKPPAEKKDKQKPRIKVAVKQATKKEEKLITNAIEESIQEQGVVIENSVEEINMVEPIEPPTIASEENTKEIDTTSEVKAPEPDEISEQHDTVTKELETIEEIPNDSEEPEEVNTKS